MLVAWNTTSASARDLPELFDLLHTVLWSSFGGVRYQNRKPSATACEYFRDTKQASHNYPNAECWILLDLCATASGSWVAWVGWAGWAGLAGLAGWLVWLAGLAALAGLAGLAKTSVFGGSVLGWMFDEVKLKIAFIKMCK